MKSTGKKTPQPTKPRQPNSNGQQPVENRAGTRQAVDHLLAHGYRRIGFVGATLQHRYGAERLEGYRDAIAASETAVDEQLVRLDDPSVDPRKREEIRAAPAPELHDALPRVALGAQCRDEVLGG